ncbi:uncharacterized protein TRAVEDRAFT_51562 [Trametes versicolor FP-101664 SS1]|uniref:uncharacterized protein n=1 Tax=Trametes versicolor (strain FP-101664) TaxID=717944 RepID=UPI000462321C|nr:uncharacterized protein TRAVEDRAFT_51562 [Trametes versicolor FP-101664 SS1]EIW53819.1 hypothetical protein TRAVEDRAFT_51562 [Trametes versicolor FP-101664 SS1]
MSPQTGTLSPIYQLPQGFLPTSTQDRTGAPDSLKSTLSIPPSTSLANTSQVQPPSGPTLPTVTHSSIEPSAGPTRVAPQFTATSATTITTTLEITALSSPEMSRASAASPDTSSHPPTSSSGASSFLQTPAPPSITDSAPSHPISSISTPALAGTIVSSILTTAMGVALLRSWVRRRRARTRRLPSPPNNTSGSNTSDPFLSANVPVMRSRSHVPSKAQADDSVPETHSRAHSLVSGSSCGARYGSVPSLEPSPSSRSLLAVRADPKDCEHHGQELPTLPPPIPVPSSTEQIPDTSDIHAVPQGASTAAPGQETATDAHITERFLNLTLPWVFGQRVLAMMADGDSHSVDSDGSEPLPAYEPHR